MSVLITRPEPDASRSAAAFAAAGIEVVCAPILFIAPRGDRPHPPEDAVLAFTSANGVRAYRAAGGPPRPAWCVGPITAAAAEEAGLAVAGVAGGDVASLAARIASAAPPRVLHVRGVHAAGALTEALAQQGIRADAAPLYEAVPAPALPDAAAAALRAGADVALYSPRSARHFSDLVRAAGLGEATARARLLALSEAVAAACALPFAEVFVPPLPNGSAFVDFLSGRRT